MVKIRYLNSQYFFMFRQLQGNKSDRLLAVKSNIRLPDCSRKWERRSRFSSSSKAGLMYVTSRYGGPGVTNGHNLRAYSRLEISIARTVREIPENKAVTYLMNEALVALIAVSGCCRPSFRGRDSPVGKVFGLKFAA
jgi:hypothetical protein